MILVLWILSLVAVLMSRPTTAEPVTSPVRRTTLATRDGPRREVHDPGPHDPQRRQPGQGIDLQPPDRCAVAAVRGTTNEGLVTGYWVEGGTEFRDVCVKVSVECDRSRLDEVVRAVKRIGRKLGQRAMYFEVAGYDGVRNKRVA